MSLPRQALADALGISRIQVFKLMQRGMPVDSIDAAKAWREANLPPAALAAAKMAKVSGGNTGRPPTKPKAAPKPAAAPATRRSAAKVQEQPKPAGQPAPPEPASVVTEHQLKTRAERQLAELKLAKEAGRVIDRQIAESAVFTFMRAFRERILTVPRRVAPDVIGLNEVRDAEILITDRYSEVFAEFEKDMPALLARMAA